MYVWIKLLKARHYLKVKGGDLEYSSAKVKNASTIITTTQ